jgi:hypothetical protein
MAYVTRLEIKTKRRPISHALMVFHAWFLRHKLADVEGTGGCGGEHLLRQANITLLNAHTHLP